MRLLVVSQKDQLLIKEYTLSPDSVPQTCKKLTTLVYLFGTNNNNLVSYSQVTIYEVGYSNAGPYSDSLLKKYRKYEIHFKASENSKKKITRQ